MESKSSMKDKIKDFLWLTLGTLMVTIGVYFFKFPNNFSTGGVSGISVILGALIPGMSTGTLVLIINVTLLIVGFCVFGRSFGIRTVYCSMLMSLSIYILERVLPMEHPLTTQPMLELVFSVLFPAVGSAILFNIQGSTGGTDIVAMIFKKFTSLDIGKALFCTDFIIATLAGVVFAGAAGQGAGGGQRDREHQHEQVFHHRHAQSGRGDRVHQKGTQPLRNARHGRGRVYSRGTQADSDRTQPRAGRSLAGLHPQHRPACVHRHHQHQSDHRQGLPPDAVRRK